MKSDNLEDSFDIGDLDYWLKYLAGLEYHAKSLTKTRWFGKSMGEAEQCVTQDDHVKIKAEIERVKLYVNLLSKIKKNNGWVNVDPSNEEE